MIGEMPFNFLIFLTVLPQDIFRNPIKSLWWSIFVACKEQRSKYMKNLKLYGSFLLMVFNCLNSTEPLQGDSLSFSTQSPGVSGTKLNLEPPTGFQPRTPGLGSHCPNNYTNLKDIS